MNLERPLYGDIRDKAVALLAASDKTKRALYKKLCYHFASDTRAPREEIFSICADVCREMESAGYINELEYATRRAVDLKRRCYGAFHIRKYLREHDVGERLSEKVIAELGNFHEEITKLITEKFSAEDLSDFKKRKKIFDSLYRRGFSSADVIDVIDELNKR